MEKRIILDEQDMNEFTKIFAKTIEDEAIKQIETLSNSEAYNSCKIRIMPDCHAGKGCTIGTVIELDNRVVPNTVGVDIGCGMKVVRLGKVDIDLQKFDEAVNKLIPSGFNVNEGEVSAYINGLVDGCMFGKFRAWDCLDSMEIVYRSVGSLGGGNHFIELDANEEGEKFLVIHTGSRNLGVRVCNYYQKLAYEYCRKKIADKSEVIAKLKSEGRENEIQSVIKSLGTKNISKELSYLEGDLLNDYLNDMRIVQKYAEQNRMIIANRLVNALGVDIDANSDKYSFTTIHNYIDTDKGILRKGAISAKKDEVDYNELNGVTFSTEKIGVTDCNTENVPYVNASSLWHDLKEDKPPLRKWVMFRYSGGGVNPTALHYGAMSDDVWIVTRGDGTQRIEVLYECYDKIEWLDFDELK